MIKSGILEFKRALHPNAIVRSRLNGSFLDQSIVYNIALYHWFDLLYLVTWYDIV